MRVFRVQHNLYSGQGPYHVLSPLYAFRDDLDSPSPADPVLHPAPFYDPTFDVRRWDYRFYFGFKSMQQAKDWFHYTPWLEAMDSSYVLAEYEVSKDDVIEGEKQLAFRIAVATKVATHPLLESLTEPQGLSVDTAPTHD